MEKKLQLNRIVTLGSIQTSIAKLNELDKIYKLRYEAYLSEDAISHNDEKCFKDKYDLWQNSINHTAHINNGLIGSIRGCFYDPNNPHLTLPSFEIFRKEIEQEIGLNSRIFESCRFVVKPNFKKEFHASLALIKTNCILSYAFNCKHSITAVREKHISFYEKMGFEKCSTQKIYPGLQTQMVLMIAKESQKGMDMFETKFKTISHNNEDRLNYLRCLENKL